MVRLKEYFQIPSVAITKRFQFLMVRLKAFNVAHPVMSQKRISIPYGAIKSLPTLPSRLIIVSFQFLMVRLKALHT